MEVRIGIVQSMKELEVELASDVDQAAVSKDIEAAIGSNTVLWLTDKKGRRVGVPAERIAYVEFGTVQDRKSVV